MTDYQPAGTLHDADRHSTASASEAAAAAATRASVNPGAACIQISPGVFNFDDDEPAYQYLFGVAEGSKLFKEPKSKSDDDVLAHYKSQVKAAKQRDTAAKYKAAFEKIREHRSRLVRFAHFFLKLDANKQMRLYAWIVFFLSASAIAIFVGAADRMDCMNVCEKKGMCAACGDHCPINGSVNASFCAVRTNCQNTCDLGHWQRALGGVFLLIVVLGCVMLAIIVISIAECTGKCNNTMCDHRITFPWPGRITTFVACLLLFLGALFGMLKLAAESGTAESFAFLKKWTWLTVISLVIAAYVIVWAGYIAWTCFSWKEEEEKNEEIVEKSKRMHPAVRVLRIFFNILRSMCPLIFVCLVGYSENGNREQIGPDGKIICTDHESDLGGYAISAPLFAFFGISIFSSLLGPFVNCCVDGHQNEFKRMLKIAVGMFFIYSFGIVGCVFSAGLLNTKMRECVPHAWYRNWQFSIAPFVAFACLAWLWSVFLIIRIWVPYLKNENAALAWWEASSDPLVTLIKSIQTKIQEAQKEGAYGTSTASQASGSGLDGQGLAEPMSPETGNQL